MINAEMEQFPIKYVNQNPFNRIAFGWGAHLTVADECKRAGIKKALITTTGLKSTGIVDQIYQILTGNGVSAEIYNKITSNPKNYEVMEAYKVFKEAECDGVVSIGGGSSHDCGKGVRAIDANGGLDILEMIGSDEAWLKKIKTLKPITKPQVSVNTTAGTGAESAYAAAITNTTVRLKQVLVVPGTSPVVAIIDPLLTRLISKEYAAWTGFDALAHAFEAYLSRIEIPHSQAMMLLVMKIISENLREFAYNRMNHVACENMCWAASMAGVGMALGSGAGLVHGIGHPVGGMTNHHHGHINAVLTIPVERGNQGARPDKFANMAQAMGVDIRGMTRLQASDKWFDEIESLLTDLNIQTGHLHDQFGLEKKDIETVVSILAGDRFVLEGNPSEFNAEECLKMLESLL